MTLDQLQKFIDEQDALFRSVKNASQTERERVLSRTVKISEEFGELCDEVLASLGDQRKGKLKDRGRGDLEAEFADVIITTFLLAKSLDVDIPSALTKKILEIKAKHNKQQEFQRNVK